MKNIIPRTLSLGFGLLFLASLPSFLDHVRYFLSGAVTEQLITGNWGLVAVNMIVFTGFLFFLRYRRRIDWASGTSYGVYSAFIVSLFVEMYGIPLTIFLGSGIITGPQQPPAYLISFDLLGTSLAMNAWMLIGVAVTVIGMGLVAGGWYQVYRADGLVTGGLYRYSRNPQYLGIICITLGWVIGWPTVLTLALFPIVVVAYYRLAKKEEEDMIDEHGERYMTYIDETPLIL